MEPFSGGQSAPNMQEIIKFAASPAGQQLLTALRQRGGCDLNKAWQKASSGDYSDAKTALSSLMDTPEMKALMQQFGR